MTERRTRTADAAPAKAPAPLSAFWIRAIHSDRPATPPERWCLDTIDELTVSGAGPASAQLEGRCRVLAIDDPWASTRHAALRKSFGRWLLEDTESKNGTFLRGARIQRHELADGDLITIGRTTWWFRQLAADGTNTDARPDLADPFITLHAPLERDLARATTAVAAGMPVLVVGETGVGKERFVAAIHAATGRPGRLVAVNCAALPATLVESELFGHRRGAFSGATEDREGYIRAADRGTLFLDEIGDMPVAAQAALLRALAERTVTPIGGDRPIPIDIAVLSATHRDLSAQGFRPDLLARLRGVVVPIAPLRDRREDIALFVARTLARVAPASTLDPEATRGLLEAPWPLNVRELESAVGAAALRATGRPIALADFDPLLPRDTPAAEPAPVLTTEEQGLREALLASLARHHGNIAAVARDLERDRKQIHRWLARFAIDVELYR